MESLELKVILVISCHMEYRRGRVCIVGCKLRIDPISHLQQLPGAGQVTHIGVGFAGVLNRRIMVRLVKGAYWDSEIKHAQVLGLRHYPVFTRKAHTDLCYLASPGNCWR